MSEINQTQREAINQLQVDVAVIKSQMPEVKSTLFSISTKMDNFAYTKQGDFDAFVKEVREGYVRKESMRAFQYIGGGIAIGVGVALIVAVIKVIAGNL